MNKNMIVKMIIAFLIGFNVAMIISIIDNKRKQNEFDNYEVLYEVKINKEFINVRKGSTTASKKIYEVLENEEYEVIETYFEDKNYNWYKIKFGMRRTGWIASDKEEAWVTIIED